MTKKKEDKSITDDKVDKLLTSLLAAFSKGMKGETKNLEERPLLIVVKTSEGVHAKLFIKNYTDMTSLVYCMESVKLRLLTTDEEK